MIYIEETSFDRQISLLKHLSKNEDLEIIMWLYPESKSRNLCGIKLAPKGLNEGEQVTTYENFKPNKTMRTVVTLNLLAKIIDEKKAISDNCDSLVLYRPNEKQWLACTIGHERIIMVNDDNLLSSISSEGFNTTLKSPEWW